MLESQFWDESTNSQKGLLLEKNARLVQFKIIDNHLSTTTAHMQRSRLFILGAQWCDQFEQLWQPADTNINATNRRNLPRNRTNPIMKPHLWIEMNENHKQSKWMTTRLTTGVNWFIHETDQNGNMNFDEIDQKREKKTVTRSKTCWKLIHAPWIIIILTSKNDSDKITIGGITPYIWENTSIQFWQNWISKDTGFNF